MEDSAMLQKLERIDANSLEKMAKERKNECFLKGSGVLKLIGGIRQLEAEVRTLSIAAATEPKWTSVKERMPEPETDVLVRVLRHGFMESFDVAGVFHGKWMSCATESETKGEVTHWMPLPPPRCAAPTRSSEVE